MVPQTSPRYTLLCVDDEVLGLEVRRITLSSQGYKVLTASDGPTGTRLAQREHVDLVVLDFSMPGMNGGEVAIALRRIKPGLHILMLSAYVNLPQEVLDQVDDFQIKGESPQLLFEKISKLLPKSASAAI